MSWRTVKYNDKYSLEENIGEEFYLFEYETPEAVSCCNSTFLHKKYAEAVIKFDKIAGDSTVATKSMVR